MRKISDLKLILKIYMAETREQQKGFNISASLFKSK